MFRLDREKLFAKISHHDEIVQHPGVQIQFEGQWIRLDATQAREAVRGRQGEAPYRGAVWSAVIRLAQLGGEKDQLFAVWLAEPWINRVIQRISLQCPVSGEDLEAEMVTCVLEGLPTADPDDLEAGERVLKSAASRAWKLAMASSRERATANPHEVDHSRQHMLVGPFGSGSWELEIQPPSHEKGLSAPIRFTASTPQIEGERLGALAHRLGLADVVRQARRPGPGRPIGRLTVRPQRSVR
ncbi:hypothetical protein [Spirillospora sp. CA-294931]|uniref:hypothetical protein n=1 Tax=Spirillospora sp. CA-294931 TaxID=3240042 RepID=UPI003D91E395